jgi:hypothetical protein
MHLTEILFTKVPRRMKISEGRFDGALRSSAKRNLMALSPFALSPPTEERPRRLGLLPSRICITASTVLFYAQGCAPPRNGYYSRRGMPIWSAIVPQSSI